MREDKVYIIGVGPAGLACLGRKELRKVRDTDLLIGSARLLDSFPSFKGRKVILGRNLKEMAVLIKSNIGQKRMTVLATGDPNFFGIARYLISVIGQDVIEIVPSISAMQLAFARIKESWDDAAFASVHSKPIESVIEVVRRSSKICLLTDGKNTPSRIAAALKASGIGDCRVYICQDLGTREEKIVRTRLNLLKNREFSPLNIMILIKDKPERMPVAGTDQVLGIPEEGFKRIDSHRSLITKLEVRAVSLAKLHLREDSVVWDIGAGTGAVSIEASKLARYGLTFAIEKNTKYISTIEGNARKFRRVNLKVVASTAPAALKDLPDPDAVFIGGSGGLVKQILQTVCSRLNEGGWVVANSATFENLQGICSELSANGFQPEVTLLNVARSKNVSDLTRLEPLNPIFIISGQRRKKRKAKSV
jgi:precorrin-6B C5,15-methyltransferase / cobalt-precorrin-6B C5,C15-methyltransferase